MKSPFSQRSPFSRPADLLTYRLAACLFVALALPISSRAQGTQWNEATVGSDWDVYARALAVRGLLTDEPWAIRPFSPSVLDQWSASLSAAHPWKERLPQRTAEPRRFEWLRPSVEVSDNTGYAWGYNDGPVWQGKGVNAWATVGAVVRWGHFSARFEPLVDYAQNEAFQLERVPSYAANPYVDAMRPTAIDLPQRMGPNAYHQINAGQSYVRYDIASFGRRLLHRGSLLGPGRSQRAALRAQRGGLSAHLLRHQPRRAHPHRAVQRAGDLRPAPAEQRGARPRTAAALRLGAGLIATWQPPSTPITIGLARFYHRDWPTPLE